MALKSLRFTTYYVHQPNLAVAATSGQRTVGVWGLGSILGHRSYTPESFSRPAEHKATWKGTATERFRGSEA